MKKNYLAILLVIISFLPLMHLIQPQSIHADGETVYVIPIENEVEKGLGAFLNRAIGEATEQEAEHIIFEVNTLVALLKRPMILVNYCNPLRLIRRLTYVHVRSQRLIHCVIF
ncbi:hypothetical protein [Halolactibacillus sp. JCM 19043]|uniref:hypothetical protein n=1 Tax=Halolactibacillus sp. JCM 19043 TaxID=1460638 RepID=UPI0035141AD7